MYTITYITNNYSAPPPIITALVRPWLVATLDLLQTLFALFFVIKRGFVCVYLVSRARRLARETSVYCVCVIMQLQKSNF